MQETPVQSLGQEDLLEKEMATRSSTLAWKIPWTEEPSGLVYGVRLSNFTFFLSLRVGLTRPTPTTYILR